MKLLDIIFENRPVRDDSYFIDLLKNDLRFNDYDLNNIELVRKSVGGKTKMFIKGLICKKHPSSIGDKLLDFTFITRKNGSTYPCSQCSKESKKRIESLTRPDKYYIDLLTKLQGEKYDFSDSKIIRKIDNKKRMMVFITNYYCKRHNPPLLITKISRVESIKKNIQGCEICSKQNMSKLTKERLKGVYKNITDSEIINNLTNKLGDKYDFSKSNVIKKIVNSGDNLRTHMEYWINNIYCLNSENHKGEPHLITTPVHYRYLMRNFNPCKICNVINVANKNRKSLNQWIEIFNKNPFLLDYDFTNSKVDRSSKYGNSLQRSYIYDIKCKRHDPSILFAEQGIRIEALLNGTSGCPICNGRESRGEREVRNVLKQMGYKVSKEFSFEGCFSFKGEKYCNLLKFDAYFEHKNIKICVEYDGEQHFKSKSFFGGDDGLESRKENDKRKDEYCEKNKIKLIRLSFNISPDQVEFELKKIINKILKDTKAKSGEKRNKVIYYDDKYPTLNESLNFSVIIKELLNQRNG